MGVTVVSLGCLVVIARMFFKLSTGYREKEAEELMIGALEHVPNEEFDGVERKKSALSKVRMKMEEGKDGRILFGRA